MTKPWLAEKLMVWQEMFPGNPVRIKSLQFAEGVTMLHPAGRSKLNIFAGDPVTDVAVTVIGAALVPDVSISAVEETATVVIGAADAGAESGKIATTANAVAEMDLEKSFDFIAPIIGFLFQ